MSKTIKIIAVAAIVFVALAIWNSYSVNTAMADIDRKLQQNDSTYKARQKEYDSVAKERRQKLEKLRDSLN